MSPPITPQKSLQEVFSNSALQLLTPTLSGFQMQILCRACVSCIATTFLCFFLPFHSPSLLTFPSVSFSHPLSSLLAMDLGNPIRTDLVYLHDDQVLGLLAQTLETGSAFSHSYCLPSGPGRKGRALSYFPCLSRETKPPGNPPWAGGKGERSHFSWAQKILPAWGWFGGECVITQAEILLFSLKSDICVLSRG